MMDLGWVVDAEAVPIALEQQIGAYNADGKWVISGNQLVATQGTVQPATGRQLMDLPEGVHTEARFLLWTRSVLAEGDIVGYAGARYRVVFLWPRPEGSFYRAALGLTK